MVWPEMVWTSLHFVFVQSTSLRRGAAPDAAPLPAVAHGCLILHAVPELATIAVAALPLEHCPVTSSLQNHRKKRSTLPRYTPIAARPHLRSTLRGNQRQHRRACDAWWRPRSPREGLPKRLQRRALRRSSWVTPRRRSWTAARTRFWTWAPTPASRRGSCINPSSTPGRRSYRSFRRRASTKTARCAAPSASSPRASTCVEIKPRACAWPI